MKYVLQVVQIIIEGDPDWIIHGGKRKHIGFMKGKFETKKDCCIYYDRHNPHLRSLNALGTYVSDWDPNTKLMYIVCKDHNIVDDIPPFSMDVFPIDGTVYPTNIVT